MSLLKIEDFSISFGSRLAVNKLNLKIARGTTTAIVGESGSGKSVTALAVLGLLPTHATCTGSVTFQNENLLNMTPKSWRRIRGNKISMIFQEPMTSLNPVFTIGEQIAEVVRLKRKSSRKSTMRKTAGLLQEVGVDQNRMHAYPHEFSGGMRQRVMVAMALANEPELLIADEPTTALDATTSMQIMDLLLESKNRRGMSMLFISHDLGVVSKIADEVCVLRAGSLVEQGESLKVLNNPSHAYTQALLTCRPSLKNRSNRLNCVPTEA